MDNLGIALDGETFEVNEMYPAYKAVAELQDEKKAVTPMHYAFGAEKIHAMLYSEKYHHFFALDVVFIQSAVQRTMKAFCADGDTGDGRNAIVTITMVKDRCLPHRAPCFANRGNQEESRFVNKDEVGRQPCGVFFTRGQADRFHSVMASSFRSRARRSGFWWLQPIWWRSLPT